MMRHMMLPMPDLTALGAQVRSQLPEWVEQVHMEIYDGPYGPVLYTLLIVEDARYERRFLTPLRLQMIDLLWDRGPWESVLTVAHSHTGHQEALEEHPEEATHD